MPDRLVGTEPHPQQSGAVSALLFEHSTGSAQATFRGSATLRSARCSHDGVEFLGDLSVAVVEDMLIPLRGGR
jgi:hypothetical protein